MPEECPHIRSIAKWVLPVFVGPRTALIVLSVTRLLVAPQDSLSNRNPARAVASQHFVALRTQLVDD